MVNLWRVLFILCSIISGAFSTVLFTDSFSNLNSMQYWQKITDDNCTLSVKKSELCLKNTSGQFSAIALHTINSSIDQYTFTAKISSPEIGSGLYFSVNETTTGYNGYGFLIGQKSLYICKYWPDSVRTLFSFESKLVNDSTNILSVSKIKNTYLLFCNGFFLKSFTDSEFSSCNIGLIVAPLAFAAFDNVEVTDAIRDTSEFSPICDSFSHSDWYGWSMEGTGAVTVDSTLVVKTGYHQMVYNTIDFPLVAFSMKVICSHRRGSIAKPYGLCLIGTKMNETAAPVLHFAISAQKKFTVTSNISALPEKSDGRINGKSIVLNNDTTFFWDTLEIMKNTKSDSIYFCVNQHQLSAINSAGFPLGGAGLFTSDSLLVWFDNFELQSSDNSVTQVYPKTATKKILHVNTSIHQQMINLLGRASDISAMNGRFANQMMIVTNQKIAGFTKRAVLQQKKGTLH